jgi:hypothetical protein
VAAAFPASPAVAASGSHCPPSGGTITLGAGATCIHGRGHRLTRVHYNNGGTSIRVCAGAKDSASGGGNAIPFTCYSNSASETATYYSGIWGYAAGHNGDNNAHTLFYGWFYFL